MQTLGEQSAAGLGATAGVPVLAVEPGSAGAAAGYGPRDVITGSLFPGPGDSRYLRPSALFDAQTNIATDAVSPIGDVLELLRVLADGGRELVVLRNQATLRLPMPRP